MKRSCAAKPEFYEKTISLLFPRRCPLCGRPVEPGALCHEACRQKTPYLTPPFCLKCGTALADDESELCRGCVRAPKSFAMARHVYPYPAVRQGLLDMKYKDRPEYADHFAAEAVRRLGREMVSWDADALVPVPLHPARKRHRGYNQAALLAEGIGRALQLPVREKAVRRVRRTAPMKALSRTARSANLEKAFAAGDASGIRRAIVVDDIYTTGTTAEAVTRVLLQAGTEKVFVVTMAAGSDAGSTDESDFL